MSVPASLPLARISAGPAPPRRPGSVRRSASIDSSWPDGFGREVAMEGRARDIVTPAGGGAPIIVASAGYFIRSSPAREILAVETAPRHPHDQQLVGARAGAASRDLLGRALGDVVGSPLYQLLDDYAGASLVAGWVWSQWDPAWMERLRAGVAAMPKRPLRDVCTGLASGSSGIDADGMPAVREQRRDIVPPLTRDDDPAGWHAMPEGGGAPAMRRARRIDLWREGESIRIDAGFQDSGNAPGGERLALHEYRVHATLDAALCLAAIRVETLILPFGECLAAAPNAEWLVGEPVADFRRSVLDRLPGTLGCTHLNDVLRALADVPHLLEHLPA